MSKDYSKLWELRKLVQEFEKLDKDLITVFQKGDIENWTIILKEIIELKEQIQNNIASELNISIDVKLANKLRQIRYNFGYNIDKFIPDDAWRGLQEEKAWAEMETGNWIHKLFSDGTADYVDERYFQRKNEIGSIIYTKPISRNIIRNMENIKECYALGLFDTAVIYCRALIEYITHELRKHKRFIDKGTCDYRSYKLSKALDQIERFINPMIFRNIKEVKNWADNILHMKEDIKVKLSELTPFEAIKWTFVFVEEVQDIMLTNR